MPLAFVDDVRCYREYRSFARHFSWPRARRPYLPTLYHCFWSGPLTQHQELCLKSLLLTQSGPYRVWLWVDREGPIPGWLRGLPGVTVRILDLRREAAGTPFERGLNLLTDGTASNVSDAVRFLALLKYGGVYFDMDVVFLNDLRPLLNVEFIGQWSNQPWGNSAVCHFRKGSRNVRALVDRGLAAGTYYPVDLLRFEHAHQWPDVAVVLPSFAFDPAWISHDTRTSSNRYCNRFEDFFERNARVTLARFFPKAYAYHWHNMWDRPLRPGTVGGYLYEQVVDRFERERAEIARRQRKQRGR